MIRILLDEQAIIRCLPVVQAIIGRYNICAGIIYYLAGCRYDRYAGNNQKLAGCAGNNQKLAGWA